MHVVQKATNFFGLGLGKGYQQPPRTVMSEGVVQALFALRVLGPVAVGLSWLSLLSATPSTPIEVAEITRVVVPTILPRRGLILTLLSLSALSFLAQGLVFTVYAVIDKTWPPGTGIEYNALLGLVAFAGFAVFGAWREIRGVSVWSSRRIRFAVVVSVVVDLAIALLLGKSLGLTGRSRIPINQETVQVIFPILRVFSGTVLVFALSSPRIVYKAVTQDQAPESSIAEESSLLPAPSTGLSPVSAEAASKYGTFGVAPSETSLNPTTRGPSPMRADVADSKKLASSEVSLDPSWREIWRRLARLSPYLWPSKSRSLQLLVVLCIVIVLVGRVVNASIPFALGEMVSIFEGQSSRSIWPVLLVYVGLRFLQGSGGLAALRDYLWMPVLQYSDREMSQLAFDHLLQLSLSFHTHRKTGEVLQVLLFTIVPTLIDIAVALFVFCFKFELLLAIVIFVVMVAYFSSSVIITRWRTKLRREMNERDIVTRGIHTDCLLNYETVKYFGGEEHEGRRYREAVQGYQQLESRVILSLSFLNLVQNLIISSGLLVCSLIVAWRVTQGQMTASDFVVFITYLTQLYAPLNQLGFMYRTINQSLVDTEKLLKLLNEPTEVNDRPNATNLVIDGGEIEFATQENVNFSYDNRTTALNGVSFKVPKGSSVALVGESGAGKSTVLRLLYRFYDLPEGGGRILIDGQDIREITQKSLRSAIGVVPQDPVLFNSSIGYNIGYGKFDSTPEEIEEAAKSAQMHERISGFPDGYDTKVGERGVRLSGGEKQRVAIARTLLKNPPILLLDEATSALDTSTEKDIQKALHNLVQGRSSLSIAHRLSTISSADIILVLKDGQIVEQGSHAELLGLGGVFASMWADQVSKDPELKDPELKDPEIADVPIVEQGYSAEPEISPEVAAEVPEVTAEIPAIGEDTIIETPEAEPEMLPPVEAEPVVAPVVSQPIAFPSSDPEPISFPTSESEVDAPLSFPVSEPVSEQAESTPLMFPTSDEPASEVEKMSPGVTFEPGLTSPTTSPDPEAEPKRKRISSQNFQRIARRISLTTRRQGSTSGIASIIPGLRRDKSDKAVPTETGSLRGETIGRDSTDSPTPSLSSDKGKASTKTLKKDKRKSTLS
ncbi:unnamed protein product [Mycena citricolor]|uniref:Uncharacterized protein n=1 Tax=Mycena citricolor TaxID=2018698 RepID=A0AAD2JWP8_9AGAR|nr:unnamed protein product [Mycena citricolor]